MPTRRPHRRARPSRTNIIRAGGLFGNPNNGGAVAEFAFDTGSASPAQGMRPGRVRALLHHDIGGGERAMDLRGS